MRNIARTINITNGIMERGIRTIGSDFNPSFNYDYVFIKKIICNCSNMYMFSYW